MCCFQAFCDQIGFPACSCLVAGLSGPLSVQVGPFAVPVLRGPPGRWAGQNSLSRNSCRSVSLSSGMKIIWVCRLSVCRSVMSLRRSARARLARLWSVGESGPGSRVQSPESRAWVGLGGVTAGLCSSEFFLCCMMNGLLQYSKVHDRTLNSFNFNSRHQEGINT